MTKRVVFIGQALPRQEASVPFGRTRLYRWLSAAGINQGETTKFYFAALVDKFTGATAHGHRPPNRRDVQNARSCLIEFLRSVTPQVVVPLGSIAIKETLMLDQPLLNETIGNVYMEDPFSALGYTIPIIPLPHPSGASPWIHLKDHKQLLHEALNHLSREIEADSIC